MSGTKTAAFLCRFTIGSLVLSIGVASGGWGSGRSAARMASSVKFETAWIVMKPWQISSYMIIQKRGPAAVTLIAR